MYLRRRLAMVFWILIYRFGALLFGSHYHMAYFFEQESRLHFLQKSIQLPRRFRYPHHHLREYEEYDHDSFESLWF